MKTCITCHTSLPLSSFQRRGSGLRNECKTCIKARMKRWHAANPGKQAGYQRKWDRENVEKKAEGYRERRRREWERREW
jgi:hypothetical protein